MLYHVEVHWPQRLTDAVERLPKMFTPRYSHHAQQAATNDRYGFIRLPESVNLESYTLIEAEFINGIVSKLVIRGPLDDSRDLVIVYIPQTAMVKTVWVNTRNDRHRNLNRSRYQQG